MEQAEKDNETLKKEWTDRFVEVSPDRPELQRFANVIGRVVTINWNNKALVDFQDGGWYDISVDCLKKLDNDAGTKYKNNNSAQVIPDKQG